MKSTHPKLDATYARYAEGRAFSGERVPTSTVVATIAADEGISISHREPRSMRGSGGRRYGAERR